MGAVKKSIHGHKHGGFKRVGSAQKTAEPFNGRLVGKADQALSPHHVFSHNV